MKTGKPLRCRCCGDGAAHGERLLAPTLEVADAVAVVPYDLACGFSPSLLVVAGFVNGFIPSRDYFDAR